MVNYLPATKVSQQNYKARHSIASPTLCFLFKWPRMPSRRGTWAVLSAAFSKEGTSVWRLRIPQEDSLLVPTQIPVNLTWHKAAKWELKLPWDLRRSWSNRKEEAGCLLINKSFNKKKWSLRLYGSLIHFRRIPTNASSTRQAPLRDSFRDSPSMELHTRPQTLHPEPPSGQSDPRQSPLVWLALPATCDSEICLL